MASRAFEAACSNAALASLVRPALRAAAKAHRDGLCKRYGIDNSARAKHGALLDALLLAAVYVELLGERQATLGLDLALPNDRPVGLGPGKAAQRPGPLPPRINATVEIAHQHFVKSLGPQALWLRFTLGNQAAAADAGA